MLSNLRTWSKRAFGNATPHTPDQDRRREQDTRERRAESISALRNDISRLQHTISDLHDTMTSNPTPADGSLQGRMDSLHRELAHCQRELATYQARI